MTAAARTAAPDNPVITPIIPVQITASWVRSGCQVLG